MKSVVTETVVSSAVFIDVGQIGEYRQQCLFVRLYNPAVVNIVEHSSVIKLVQTR